MSSQLAAALTVAQKDAILTGDVLPCLKMRRCCAPPRFGVEGLVWYGPLAEPGFKLDVEGCRGCVCTAGIIYWADVFMGFATGFVVIHNLRRRVIRRPVSIAEYYVRYGTFWPDFLASLPTIAEASLVSHLRSQGRFAGCSGGPHYC